MSEEVFKKFLVFLASNLEESKDLLILVQKRYDECDDKFRISMDFQTLVENVQSRISKEKHRIFVHLKDFLTKLKSFRIDSNDRKRKQDGISNNLAKRLCTGNSCSDVSSDSDFFKKVNKNQTKKGLKNDLSSTKSISPKDIDIVHSPSSSTVKKLNENSKTAMGKSRDEPWPISEEESLSLDSVRSDTKSSDSSDMPLYLNTTFTQEPESISVDSVSSESKSSRLTPSPNTANELSLNTKTSLPNHSRSNKNATDELPENHESEAEPETPVVIDDNIPRSGPSLPCVSPAQHVNEVENVGTLEKSDSIEKDDTESMTSQKKKGSERQIKRLEKLLGDIRDEIEITTKKELSMEDLGEEDSSYVYEDRLQKKFVKVWEKLCELKGQGTSTGRPIEKRFHFQGTRYVEINKRIEKFINKKKIFPDYNDIKKIVTQVNTHYNLYLGKPAIEDLAREAFTDVGNQLQDRRHKNFILTFGNSQTEVSSIAQDPALYNTDLRKKLQENRKLAKTKLDEVISKYSKMQYETNAQPEEVDDNALDSSSDEEEEETQDIPELDEVMALSDDDDISEIPEKSPLNSGMLLTKNLKIQIEKLNVPPGMLVKKKTNFPSSTTSSCSSTVATSQNVNKNNTVAIPNTGVKPLPSHTVHTKKPSQAQPLRFLPNRQNSKAASNEIVIDLDSSSDADDSAEVINTVEPSKQQALVPLRTQFPTNVLNSSNCVMNPAHSASSSSSSTMVMSSQNNMQFSMQVKTQFQQQKQDGFSLKIASVTSLAYAIKDNNRNSQYFTSKQTNFQNQGIHLTSGNTYKQISKRPILPAPSNSVIVLSDSD